MFETLAIICSVFFLLSFLVLFRKPLSRFFSFLFSPIKKSLAKSKKKKEERLKQSRVIIPKLASAVPYQKIASPMSEPADQTAANHPEQDLNKDNSPYNLAKERMKSIRSQMGEDQGNDNEKSQIQSDLNRLSKSSRLIDPSKISVENRNKISRFNNEEYLPPFIKTRLESDESAILAKRKQSEIPKRQSVENYLKQKNSPAEVEIDGEKIDLSKLPPNIKKLLLSGILDKKDF